VSLLQAPGLSVWR